MENKIKHLEMIEAIVNRMGNNSFMLKAWCVTLVTALLALGAKDSNEKFFVVGYYPLITFWILDAYFLRQERLFRKLFDKIRLLPENVPIDFSMDTESVQTETWIGVAFSKTLLLFYGTMIGAILLAMFVVGHA